jgi:hypothetical protein
MSSTDLIGRRQAVAQRLDRARVLELALQEKINTLAETAGVSIDQFDADGAFRASLTALAGLAHRRSSFDVIVAMPETPFGVRIQHLDDGVSVEIVVHEDGPFQSFQSPPPAHSPSAQPALSARATSSTQPSQFGQPAHAAWPIPSPASDPGRLLRLRSPEPPGFADVAADLAALLWQGIGDTSS